MKTWDGTKIIHTNYGNALMICKEANATEMIEIITAMQGQCAKLKNEDMLETLSEINSMSMLVSISNQGADKDGLIVMGEFFSNRQLWKLSEDEITNLITDSIGEDRFQECCKFTNIEEQIKSKVIKELDK